MAKEIMGKIKGSFAKTYDSFIKRPGLLPGGLLEMVRSMDVKGIADFACGTGNMAVGFSLEGYDVTGVDYSPDMLKVARRKAREQRAAIKFVLGDISDVDLGRKFDLLLCLGNTMPHFTNKRKLDRLLNNCKRHLRPGGHIIIQQLNYDRMVKDGSGTFAVDIDGEIVRFKQNRFKKGTADFVVTIVDGRTIPPAVTTSKVILKPWLRAELVGALIDAGFYKVKALGSYREDPFGPKSKDLILIGTLCGGIR